MEKQIEEFLSSRPEELRDLAQELRTFLKKETEPSYELLGQSVQSFNIGYAFTTTAWDSYCVIIVYKNHINISLPSGASLPDPDGILPRHGLARETHQAQGHGRRALCAGAQDVEEGAPGRVREGRFTGAGAQGREDRAPFEGIRLRQKK